MSSRNSSVERIDSVHNAGVKRVVRLRTKKSREARGQTIVEGVREVRQALRAGLRFSCVYICREGVYHCPDELYKELQGAGVRILETGCSVYDRMAYGDRREGVLALVEQPHWTLDSLALSSVPLVVVLENVEKPGNLGAILRTADGAGVDALLVCDEKTDIYNPNTVRASLGAVFTVPTATCPAGEALAFLRAKGIRTFAAVVQATDKYSNTDMRGPAAVILGSEQDGLSEFWRRNTDESVCIPMLGKVDSLNVSVAAALMIYEAVRQRAK